MTLHFLGWVFLKNSGMGRNNYFRYSTVFVVELLPLEGKFRVVANNCFNNRLILFNSRQNKIQICLLSMTDVNFAIKKIIYKE